MEEKIVFSKATRLARHSQEYGEVKNSYLFCSLADSSSTGLDLENKPLKIDGSLMILVKQGSFDLEINLEMYHVSSPAVVFAFPGNVVQLKSRLPEDLDAYLLFFNVSFLQNININMSAINLPPIGERTSPVMELTEEECELMGKYMELLNLNTRDTSNQQISRNIASSLIAASFYQMVLFRHRRIVSPTKEPDDRPASRRNDYVRQFMKLLYVHFIRERSVSFYADKLYISPKYLSLLVKEATGRSASRWIDDFVLMEAKNMLRFSGKNIQQVAYALNFSTQSSFGKYFKHLTGMSPTEYQKS